MSRIEELADTFVRCTIDYNLAEVAVVRANEELDKASEQRGAAMNAVNEARRALIRGALDMGGMRQESNRYNLRDFQ